MHVLPSLLLLTAAALCGALQDVAVAKHRSGRYEPGLFQPTRFRRHALGTRSETIQNKTDTVVTPKVFIISMFGPEADIWYTNMPEILSNNITIQGFAPVYPDAHCTETGEVCQLTTGAGEINAAATISALVLSTSFNLTETYFLIAGIAGINPHLATTGSVTFSQYQVQFDLQYEFSADQIASNYSSGYIPQGTDDPDSPSPDAYPTSIYGTEAFEVNKNLRDRFISIASSTQLNDSDAAATYRARYPYAPANQPPSVVACASGTSNVYWSGSVLGDAFTNYTLLLTNGSGVYCATQQEDNASLEAFLRGAMAGVLDFSRIAVMRTASDFDRAPPGGIETYHLLYAEQGGFLPAIQNIFIAGNAIVNNVLDNWNSTYAAGVKAENYIGDLFNSLGSEIEPDIGTEAIYIN